MRKKEISNKYKSPKIISRKKIKSFFLGRRGYDLNDLIASKNR